MEGRRSIAVIIGLAMLSPTIVSAITLTDITGLSEETAIQGLVDRRIIQGYNNGTFRPTATINRAEFLKILIGSRFPHQTPKELRCFADLEVKMPQWYAATVCSARELGIVSGYSDGTFRPDKTVNLAEALKMALRTFGIVPANDRTKPWYEPSMNEARSRSILLPLLKYPEHLLTRAEMASLTYALILERESIDEHPQIGAPLCGNGIKEGIEQCDPPDPNDQIVRAGDGNARCSSICILVTEPVRRAFLELDAQATGTVSNIAQGQKHLALLKFTATAGRQDALLTSLTFSPTVGSLLYASHYTLAMDRNGTGRYDTIVQADGRADGSKLVFNSFTGNGVVIPQGLSIPFVVIADLVATLGPVSLGINFATDEPDYVQAQGAIDGLALTGIETNTTCTASDCFMRVNTTASRDITVIERGNLWVSEDSTPAANHLVLGGSISPPLLRLRLHADGEAVDVKQIRIDGITNSVDSLLFYRLAANGVSREPFAVATTGQCSNQPSTRACAVMGLSTLLVPPNQEVTLAIAAKMKDDQRGAVSGEHLTLSLSDATSSTDAAIEARGISSLQDLQQNNGNATAEGEIFIGISSPGGSKQILGRTSDTTLASISAITNAGPISDIFIPSGNTIIGSFQIHAFPHTNTKNGSNDVLLKTLIFSVHAQNVQIDPASYRLVTADDTSAELGCGASETTGVITVSCTNIDSGSIQGHLAQGQSVTYTLKANVTNTSLASGRSTLTVELPILGSRSQTNSVIWSDEETTFSWVDTSITNVASTVYQTR